MNLHESVSEICIFFVCGSTIMVYIFPCRQPSYFQINSIYEVY